MFQWARAFRLCCGARGLAGDAEGIPTHLAPVELESEDKSVTTAIVQTETAATGCLVLGAGVAKNPE